MQKIIFGLFCTLSLLFAKEAKLELGIGMAVIGYPDYIGSKSRQLLISPFPYIRYYGENFQIEKGGIKKELFDIDGLSMDLSLSGSLPSDSENSAVRQGMPDLDLTFEMGPKVTYQLYKDERRDISFKMPVRAVFATDFTKITSEGFLTTPRVRFEYYPLSEIELSFTTGPMWASRGYHDYFYSVDRQYVTDSRTTYNASGGYSGYRNACGLKYQTKKWWFGTFATHFALSGAVFEDSPLVEQKNALFAGASFAYLFYIK